MDTKRIENRKRNNRVNKYLLAKRHYDERIRMYDKMIEQEPDPEMRRVISNKKYNLKKKMKFKSITRCNGVIIDVKR